jgi:hypothetical protein
MKPKLLKVFAIFILYTSCFSESKKTENSTELGVKIIPGLTAVDVYGNFTNKGFILEKNFTPEGSSWICKSSDAESEFIVDVYGSSPTNIINIRGTVLNYSTKKTTDIAKDFLGYLASIPYENSHPEIAKEWILNNIERGGTTVISNVKFEILANGERNRILNISEK